jgi:hypothetical protein
MYQFSLEWVEEGRKLSQTFLAKDDTKQKGKFFIGRDEKQCDMRRITCHKLLCGF